MNILRNPGNRRAQGLLGRIGKIGGKKLVRGKANEIQSVKCTYCTQHRDQQQSKRTNSPG